MKISKFSLTLNCSVYLMFSCNKVTLRQYFPAYRILLAQKLFRDVLKKRKKNSRIYKFLTSEMSFSKSV